MHDYSLSGMMRVGIWWLCGLLHATTRYITHRGYSLETLDSCSDRISERGNVEMHGEV